MMTSLKTTGAWCAIAGAFALTFALSGCSDKPMATGGDKTAAPAAGGESKAASGEIQVTGCDGGVKTVPAAAEGQALADSLMDQWKRDHPDRSWVEEEKEKHELKPPADNSALLKGDQGPGHTYGRVTEQDLLIWARETEKMVVEGSRIFHGAKLLGSSVGVSCDMCHPHAANTHPETYPKFQAQLGRTVLLRDMINWCIENPSRGTRLEADDPKMRALEAYIMAQRSGTPMQYGKH
jgi:thiosulfate dehydrogenase